MKDMTDQEFVETIVKAIVDHPEEVKTERTVDDKGTLISLTVHEEDMGKIIGKGGRTVNSIRKLLHVLGAKSDERVNLKIFEPDGGEVHTPEHDHEGDHDHHDHAGHDHSDHEGHDHSDHDHKHAEDEPKAEPAEEVSEASAEEEKAQEPAEDQPKSKKDQTLSDIDTDVLV